MKHVLRILLVVVLCSGCVMGPWVKTPEQEYRHSGLAIRAVLPKGWMRANHVSSVILTRDGLTLDRIDVSRLKFKDKLEYTKRKFTEDMSPLELAEVEIDNMKSGTNIGQVNIISNQPATIAGVPAYHLQYTYETVAGLKIRGQQYGFVANDRIYRVAFEATEQHYYEQTVKDFEQFVQSLHIIKKDSK